MMLSSRSIFQLLSSSLLISNVVVLAQFSEKYKNGVAIGGWLVAESWIYPLRWQQMGGEKCDNNPATCASSEWGLVHKLGQARANEVFLSHWKTWFTQEHVDRIKAVNLDHVKIPLGFWIIEELVKAPGEMYAQGGWMELKRGLRQLKKAGLNVLLDMHAMPGVSATNQGFAGNITEEMHFYEEGNYRRALTWLVILTAMSHLDPDFHRVLGILFINEPHPDAGKTPGLGTYYRDAVTTVRVVEYALGIGCNVDLAPSLKRMAVSRNVVPALLAAVPLLSIYAAKADPPLDVGLLTRFLQDRCHQPSTTQPDGLPGHPERLSSDTLAASRNSSFNTPQTVPSSISGTPITTSSTNTSIKGTPSIHSTKYSTDTYSLVNNTSGDLNLNSSFYSDQETHRQRKHSFSSRSHGITKPVSGIIPSLPQSNDSTSDTQRSCLTTVAMPKRWQWKGDAESMAPHVLGPRAYDDHLYFSFGGVANASYESYMDTICSYNGFEVAKNNSEVPYGTGEFSLATNFNDTPSQLRDWGDAQKLLHAKESFWTFWTFRIEESTDEDSVKLADHWSYLRAVDRGLLPENPTHYFNTSICQGRNKTNDIP